MGPGPGWGYRVAGFADGVGFCVAALKLLKSKVIILAGADKRNTTLSVATAFAVVIAVADVSFGM